MAVVLKGKDAFGREADLALVRAPRSLPRLVRLPKEVASSDNDVVLLSAILQDFVDDLFPGMKVKGVYPSGSPATASCGWTSSTSTTWPMH